VGGNHAEQAAAPLDERRRLDRAEGGGGRDVTMGREPGVDFDIDDDRLGPFPGRPSARRPAVIDYGEVLEELGAETALGGDPQRTGRGVDNLDIAAVRTGQRQGPSRILPKSKPGRGTSRRFLAAE